VPSIYHLVATSVIEMEFNRGHTDRRKCVDLIPEFSNHSNEDYSQLSD